MCECVSVIDAVRKSSVAPINCVCTVCRHVKDRDDTTAEELISFSKIISLHEFI